MQRTSNFAPPRYETLDWLRGLLALSIMLYHLTYWHIGDVNADSFLGVLSLYGVAMFFILSGLSMALVYHKTLETRSQCAIFIIRRAFRILPLLWLAVATVTAVSMFIRHEDVSFYKIVLNITGLFGFIDPAAYINTGAWSIGNELVYYALTPFLISVYTRSLLLGNLVFLLCSIQTLWFAFFAISAEQPLADQWATYINPLNNLSLYVGGLAIYYNTSAVKPSLALPSICLVAGLVLFLLYPASGDVVTIITGSSRMVYCLACLLTVYGFYQNTVHLPPVISRLLTPLGLATYGIYLLHPIINSAATLALRKTGLDLDPVIVIGVVSLISIGAALATYRLIEVPMIRLGKIITTPEAHRLVAPSP